MEPMFHVLDAYIFFVDTLAKMDRDQLQKLAQYMIASHPDQVLPCAQNLAEGLLEEDSTMNKTLGAPDPTAGGGIEDSSTWYFDESGVREQFRADLAAIAAGGFGSGHSAFDGLPSQSNPGMSSNFPGSHSYGRLFASSFSKHGRCRSSRYSTTAADEHPSKSRSLSGRIFAQAWLEHYRHLQKLKFPPFGFMTLPVSSVSQSSLIAPHNTGSPHNLQMGYSQTNSGYSNPSNYSRSQVAVVFAKTYELLSIRDTNGPRLLRIITEELLNSASMMGLRSRRNQRGIVLGERINWDPLMGDFDDNSDDNDAQDIPPRRNNNVTGGSSQPPIWTIPMWEEVGRLWASLLLASKIEQTERQEWLECLQTWSSSMYAPRDAVYRLPAPFKKEASSETNLGTPEPVSVFQLARDVSLLTFDISVVKDAIPRDVITEVINKQSSLSEQCFCPFCVVSAVIAQYWSPQETFITLCLRASALNATGYESDGSKLAFLLAKTLLDCLDEVCEKIAVAERCPSPTNRTRSNSGNSVKVNGQGGVTSPSGSGNQFRGGSKGVSVISPLPPPPSQTVAHNCSPFHQHNPYPFGSTFAPTSTYLSFPQPAINPPCGNGGCMNSPHFFNPPCQNNRYRCSSWTRNNSRMSDTVHFPSFCCSETSLDCPFHEHGWLGLPGRPIISLVECLLEAAAQKVEESKLKNTTTASDYIHLALKHLNCHPTTATTATAIAAPPAATASGALSASIILAQGNDDTAVALNPSLFSPVGILVLCQQRSLPQSSRALMVTQCQETLLIQLLNTIPRNAMTAQIIVPLVCQLMGLRLSSSQQYLSEAGNPEDWWWSALGPLVHPDVFPVHVVAEFLFGHLLQGEPSNPCMGDLAYYIVVRSMRFPVLEPTSDSIQIANDSNSTDSRGSEAPTSPRLLRLPPPPSYFHGVIEKPPTNPSLLSPGYNLRRPDGSQSRSRSTHHPALAGHDASAAAYRRDLAAMEGRQARLAISLILASRQPSARVDHFLRICDRHIHSALSLLSVSREIMAEAIGHRLHNTSNASTIDKFVSLTNDVATIMNGGLDSSSMLPINFETSPLPSNSVQERIALVTTSFHLALCVAVRTLWPRYHDRRQELLGWVVSTGILAGPNALRHLVQSWSSYASTTEAVKMLAPTMLNCLSYLQNASSTVSGPGGNSGRNVRNAICREGNMDALCLSPTRIYSFYPFSLANLEQIRSAVRTMIVQVSLIAVIPITISK
ncbi:hypothetical protein Aperf_G00000085574 [Anoplocephala perfoliata]